MSSKYRGDPDDESLEHELPPRPKSTRKLPEGRARVLTREEGNAVVAELFPNRCAVRLDGRAETILCGYRMATLAFNGAERERSPVCVGDRVLVEAAVIVGRCERKNALTRPAPNSRDRLLHAVAANLDMLVVVAAAREPEFSSGIVDRFIVAASAQGIPSILCVNKLDLLEPGAARPWECYPAAGVALVETSAKDGSGAETLAALVRGKAAAFCGHSGVGKTSLLRRLLADPGLGRVGAVNAASGKGRHTTTGAVLLPAGGGSTWIDTPGIMNFGLLGVSRADLIAHFPELAAASKGCAPDCAHGDEPSCALQGQPRLDSYRRIRESL